MSPFRRLIRVPTTKLVLFVLVYSVALCQTSTTFDFFKRSSSGGPGPGPGSGSASKTNKDGDGERDFENSHHFSGSVSRGGEESHQNNLTSQPGPSIETYEQSADDSGQGHSHSHHGDGHHYGKDNMMTARDHGGWGGWGGWGWGGHGGHGGDSTLDLYSVLGGLSFASLLGATIAYLARRSTGTTTVMMNTSGRRRRRDLDDADEELAGESLPEFLAQLGVHLESPWWEKGREEDKKIVVPFKLNM